MRWLGLVIVGMMAGAAAPDGSPPSHAAHHPHPRHHPRHRHPKPQPAPDHVAATAPDPSARSPGALEPAPLPNPDAAPPPAPAPSGPAVSGERLQIHYPPVGDGFLPGSSSTVIDNAKAAKVPGLNVTIPVTQDPVPQPPP